VREFLDAIGLSAAYQAEINLRVRVGLPIIERAIFLRSASPLFLTPDQFMRALQCGIQFSQKPPNVQLTMVDGDGGKNGGGLGRDHRVGGGAQRIYPLRRNPQ
jgi:hypothetical protein